MRVLALCLVWMSLLSSGCAFEKPVELPQLPELETTFVQYRVASRQWLTDRSMRHRTQAAIELNLPFEIPASVNTEYRGRFLLFHGLNDSPYVWHNYAHELAERGFDVRAMLFEGHGSTPEDMLSVHWRAWLSSARQQLNKWHDDDVPMYLGGFSMGAVVATWLALDNPSIAGLLLISPAYKSKLSHYLRWSGLYARFRPWVFGGMILEDNPIKYNSIPVNSGWQYYQLTAGLKQRWKRSDQITAPTLMVLSEDDSVVDHDYTRHLFEKRFSSAKSVLLSYSATDNVTEVAIPTAIASAEIDLTIPADFRKISRSSVYPDLRILNQSHLGLMYSQKDPLFGEQGSVLVCNGNEYPVFMACMRAHSHWFGAQHTPSPDGVPVARTTYNPDWIPLLDRLEQVFIAQ